MTFISERIISICSDSRTTSRNLCTLSPDVLHHLPQFRGRREPGVNPRLLVIAGPLRDRTILLHSAETPVGREPGNAVAISDPSLSRRHCALVRDEAGYSIRDLESRNGTFVNGVAVTESHLHHGDQISV